MLYRMYTRWAERHGFTYKILDYLDGDEAGLKSASIMIVNSVVSFWVSSIFSNRSTSESASG